MGVKMLKGAFAGLALSVSGIANAGLVTLEAQNSGWYDINGISNGNIDNTCTGCGSNLFRAWFGWDLNSIALTEIITSANLVLYSDSLNQENQNISFHDVVTSYANLGQDGLSTYTDLGQGVLFSSGIGQDLWNTFELTAGAISALNTARGSRFAIGAVNDSGGDWLGYNNGVSTSGSYYRLEITTEATPSVPEPSTIAILTLGLMGIAARRYKKQ
jgi:hypothetical protein